MLSSLFKSFNQADNVKDAEAREIILQQGQLFIHLTTNWFYGDSFKPCLAVPSCDHHKQAIMLENNPKVTKIDVNAKSIILSSMNTIDKARNVLVREIQSVYQLEDRRFLERILETPWVKREQIESFTSTTDMLLFTLSHPTSLNVLDWVLLQKEIKWEHRDLENNTLLHLAIKNCDDVEKIVYVMHSVYNAKPELINQLNTARVTPLELSIQLNKLNSRLLDCFQTNKAKIFNIQQDGAYTILLDRFEVGILDTELVVSSESFDNSKLRICSPIFGPYHCVMCQTEEFQGLTSTEFTVDCQAKMYSFPCTQLISFLTSSNGVLMDLHIAARYSCAINLPHLFNQQTYLKLIDKNGNNLLHSSLLAADLSNFTHLLALHRDIDTRIDLLMMPNSESVTPMHILIDKHEYGLIRSFLAYRTINGNNLCHIAIAANDIRLLRVILEETGSLDLCNELNGQGESPLILGINRESTPAVEHLLAKAHGCKLEQEDNQGRNCLHISIMKYNEDMFTLLLSAVVEYGSSYDVINSKLDGLTPFLLSLKEHKPDAAIKLVKSSAFIGRGRDLFPYVMDYYNNSLSLKELITLPLNQENVGNDFNPSKVASILNLRDEQKNSILHYSLKSGIVTGFQNILKESPLNIILTLDNENNHILLTALKLELIDQCNNIVDVVLDHADSAICDAFVNQKNIYGECPISLSVIRGYTYVITVLIRLKTRLDVVDDKNNNIFHTLLEQPSSQVVFGTFKFLMEETHLRHLLTQTNDLKENPLHLVVKNGHVDIISLLIKEDIIDGFKEADGSTLLHCAVICDSSANQESVIQEILKHKDILNTPDFSGQTPLFYAIIRTKLAIVKLLLEKRPNLSTTDNSGQDILHYALAGLDCLIFQTVLIAFNQSKLIDYGNYLLYCIKQGNLFYLKEMLALKPKPEFTVDCQAKMYSFPCTQLISFLTSSNGVLMDLHIAARYSCAINLPHLFNQQTYLKLIDKNGNNLLHSSLLAADLSNFAHLLALHRDIDTRIDLLMMPNSESVTPMHILIDKHEYGLIRSFLAYRTINGNNLCHIAMAANDIRLLRVILEETGSLDLCNELNGQGESPLILGIIRESTPAVEHLLAKAHGCKLEQEDNQGRNCLHISIMKYNEDMFTLLLSAVVEYGSSYDVINSKLDGLTPFLLSLKEHRPDAAIKLVKSSAFIGRGRDLFPYVMDYYNNSLSLKELITLPLNQENVGNDFNPSKVASILDLRDEQKNSILHYSLKSGIVTGFQNILKESPLNIILTLDNENNHILLTALKLELIDQCNNIVDVVLDHADSAICDAFVNQKNIYGECPISLSVIRGYTYVITVLIRLKTRLVDDKNNNIFHTLLEQPSSQVVFGTFKFLMEETHLRHLLTQTNDLKENPLHLVVKNSHVDIISLLIKEDIIDGFKEADGSTLLHCAVICDSSANQESVIQEILKHKDILNTPDFSGQTPLFYAIIRTKLAIVKLLLEKRPNLSTTDNSGQDILHYALAGLDCLIFQTVLIAFNQSKLIDYGNYLLYCIKQGNLFYLKEMLALKPSINLKDNRGSTLLHHLASRRDRAKMLQSLVTHIDASSNEECYALCDNGGKTPLHIAIENGDFYAFKLMFRSTYHLYARDKQGDTVLHSAARSSDSEIMNDLLRLLCATLKRKEFHSFLHIKNTRSLSALHLAIKLRRDYCVQCLIDARANLSSASKTGGVSLSGGSEDLTLNIYSATPTHNSSSVSQELGNCPATLHAGYSIDLNDSLFIVAELPELNVTQVKESHEIFPVTSIAEKSLKLLLKSPSAEPLRLAVKNKLIDPMKDLFKSGSMSDIISEEISLHVSEYLMEIDTSDLTQHFKACSNLVNTVTGSIDCLHSQLKLLSECEELNLRNDEQVFKNYLIWKAVVSSLESLTPEALELFLSYGLLRFDYHYCFYKKSLLHYAIERGKPVNFICCILKYIQELEVSCPEKAKLNGDRFIDVSNSQGKTALHLCIEEKQIDVLKTLLDFSPDVTKPDSNRNTPLHTAISSLSAEMVKHLIAHVLKHPTPRKILHLQNSDRLTPLQLAVDLGNLPVLTCLLSNECSTYLLDFCFRNKKTDLLNLLLKAGSGLDIRDSFGNSVLHLAVIDNDIRTMQDLIATVKRKYDVCSFLSKTNDMGITPLHAAIKYNNLQAVKILVSEGAQLINNEKFGEHTNTRFDFMRKLKFVGMKTDPEILYLGFKLASSHCIVTCLPEMKKTQLIRDSSQNLNILTEMNVISICCCESSIPFDLAINAKLIRENTPLLDGSSISNLISKVGSVDVVEIFLARFSGFTTYLRRGWNMSMIESAVYNPKLKVLKLLLDKLPSSMPKSEKIQISYCLSNSLKLSIENELTGAFDLLLNKQADVYSTYGINSNTLLHLMVINVASSGFISSVMKRISLVEDKQSAGLRFIDYQNSNGRTALHSSTDIEREQTVECLLTWSPDLSIRDSRGNTALHLAVQSNNIKIVRMLITALKNAPGTTQSLLDSQNKIGCRPLHLAVLVGNVSITELLLETECAYSSTQDRFGDTFLHYAVYSEENQLILVKLLIKFDQGLHSKKRMLNTRDRRGNTPLLLAEALEREDIVKCIRTLSGTADQSNSQALQPAPNGISYRLVRILAEQTDVGCIPREIIQELGINSHFLSTPNSQASITGCYWCGDSSGEMDGLTCSTACFFRLHTWCLGKAELFCGVLLCGLPGCSSEVMGGTHGCCSGTHLKELLALRGKDLKSGDKNCPYWYEEMPP